MSENQTRLVVIHRPNKGGRVMNDMIKGLLASMLRKIIFGAGAVYIAYLTEKGIATSGDVERLIEIAVAALLILVPALWTAVKNLLAKKTE